MNFKASGSLVAIRTLNTMNLQLLPLLHVQHELYSMPRDVVRFTNT